MYRDPIVEEVDAVRRAMLCECDNDLNALMRRMADAAAGCASSSPAPAAPGRAAVPAPVVTLSGQSTEVASVARGRVALVSLWATWCEACRAHDR